MPNKIENNLEITSTNRDNELLDKFGITGGKSMTERDNDILRECGITGKNDSANFVNSRKTIKEMIVEIGDSIGLTKRQKWTQYLEDVDKMI